MSNTGDMHWIQWKRTTQPFISHLCLDSCSPPFSDSTQEEHLHLGFGPRQVHPTTPPHSLGRVLGTGTIGGGQPTNCPTVGLWKNCSVHPPNVGV